MRLEEATWSILYGCRQASLIDRTSPPRTSGWKYRRTLAASAPHRLRHRRLQWSFLACALLHRRDGRLHRCICLCIVTCHKEECNRRSLLHLGHLLPQKQSKANRTILSSPASVRRPLSPHTGKAVHTLSGAYFRLSAEGTARPIYFEPYDGLRYTLQSHQCR